MDDEAQLRMALIIAFALVVVFAVCIFGLGAARDGVPQATAVAQAQEAKSQGQVTEAKVRACKSLPEAKRDGCIEVVAEQTVLDNALMYCNDLETDSAEVKCISDVMKRVAG